MQKSTVGGILSIVSGALGLVGGLITLMVTLFASTYDFYVYADSSLTEEQLRTLVTVIYGGATVFALVVGVLAIIGGIFAIQRKHWGWSLAGAIASIFTFLPLGIAAVILVAMGRSEFDDTSTIAQQPPAAIS